MDPNYLPHQTILGPATVHEESIRSHHPFVPAAWKLLRELLFELSIRAAQWTDYKWDVKCFDSKSVPRLFALKRSARPLGMRLLRPAWAPLNRLRTGVGTVIHAQTGTCSCINL